jgi:hypothetical protein
MAKLYAMHKHLADFAIAGVDLYVADTDTI